MARETEVDVKPRVKRVGDNVLLVTADVSTDETLVVDVEVSADVEESESISAVVGSKVDVRLPLLNALTEGTLIVGENIREAADGVLVVVMVVGRLRVEVEARV